jgi:hypothetical protein
VTSRKDDAPAAVQEANVNVAGLGSSTWGFLNKAKSTALQWMSAVSGGKMHVNGPI